MLESGLTCFLEARKGQQTFVSDFRFGANARTGRAGLTSRHAVMDAYCGGSASSLAISKQSAYLTSRICALEAKWGTPAMLIVKLITPVWGEFHRVVNSCPIMVITVGLKWSQSNLRVFMNCHHWVLPPNIGGRLQGVETGVKDHRCRYVSIWNPEVFVGDLVMNLQVLNLKPGLIILLALLEHTLMSRYRCQSVTCEVQTCHLLKLDMNVQSSVIRPDNNLQDVRTKIFPLKKRKMKAPESIPLVSAPARRKERSLSSLVINTPPVSTQAGFPSRTKAVARKAAASRGLVNKLNCGREVDDAHDHSERLDSSERSSKMFMLSRRQRNSGGEPSNDMADDDIQNSAPQEVARQRTGKAASWEPLACLAEAANRTETSQLPLLGLAAVKTEEPDKCRSIKHANGMKRRVSGSITSSRKKESSKIHPGTNSRMARKLHAGGPDRVSIARKRRSVAGASENGSSLKCERRSNPVWFALLASENQ
eukprot:Gb_34801 [translate_table: standard]